MELVLPPGCMRSARLAGSKITLRFPHLFVSIFVLCTICMSTLITCTIITSHTLLPCDLALVDFGNFRQLLCVATMSSLAQLRV